MDFVRSYFGTHEPLTNGTLFLTFIPDPELQRKAENNLDSDELD